MGSNGVMHFFTYNGTRGTSNRGVTVKFLSPIKYKINHCASWTEFPVQPPDEEDKIWAIRKTNTTLSIECNGVRVLNYQFSDSSENECVPNWGGDFVDRIRIANDDTASDFYGTYREFHVVIFCKFVSRVERGTGNWEELFP